MQQMQTDEERRQAIKTLEPAFSTYAMGDIMKLGLKRLIWHGVKNMLSKNSRYSGDYEKLHKHTDKLNTLIINALTPIPGLITSRLPNRKSSFGYIFEDSKISSKDGLASNQVRFAQAKATT